MAIHSRTIGLENPMDGGAWWAAVHGVVKSRTQLSDFTFYPQQGPAASASPKSHPPIRHF